MPSLYLDSHFDSTFDVIHVKSNQKVQCNPSMINNQYTCVFAFIFEGCEENSNLIAYPKAQDEKVNISFIGDKVDSEQIERNNITFITK